MYDLQLAVKYAEPDAVLLGMAADCVYYQWISRKSAGGAEEPASHIPPTHTHTTTVNFKLLLSFYRKCLLPYRENLWKSYKSYNVKLWVYSLFVT